VRQVRLATNAELHEFVLQVLRLADNPKRRRDLLAGRLRFVLAPAGPPSVPVGSAAAPAPGRANGRPARANGRGLPVADASEPGRGHPVRARTRPGAPRPGSATPDSASSGREAAGRARPAAGTGGGDLRIERGAVTERTVLSAAGAGARLVLGPRAVLTPLARDRARTLGVPIEKER